MFGLRVSKLTTVESSRAWVGSAACGLTRPKSKCKLPKHKWSFVEGSRAHLVSKRFFRLSHEPTKVHLLKVLELGLDLQQVLQLVGGAEEEGGALPVHGVTIGFKVGFGFLFRAKLRILTTKDWPMKFIFKSVVPCCVRIEEKYKKKTPKMCKTVFYVTAWSCMASKNATQPFVASWKH